MIKVESNWSGEQFFLGFQSREFSKNVIYFEKEEVPGLLEGLKEAIKLLEQSPIKDHKVAFARTYSIGEPIIIGWFAKPHTDGTFNVRLLQKWLYDEFSPVGPRPSPAEPCEFSIGPLPLDFYECMPKTPVKWKDKTKINFDCGLEFPLTKFGVNKEWKFNMNQLFNVTNAEFEAILAECYKDGFECFDNETFCK